MNKQRSDTQGCSKELQCMKTDCEIGNEGATALSNALKTNTSLTSLYLDCNRKLFAHLRLSGNRTDTVVKNSLRY